MDSHFNVEAITLHLVDRQLPAPRSCKKTILLNDYLHLADRMAIKDFFCNHLDEMWQREESQRTRSASFQPGSSIQSFCTEISRDQTHFYARSCDMAQLLHKVSQGTTASPGVLVVLRVCRLDRHQPYLVLMKFDPSPGDFVGLGQAPDGQLLLDLAVHHIDLALPTSGERVLKWAALPHPNREHVDAKVRDEQSKADPARYFMNFLGCTELRTEKDQVARFLHVFPAVAEKAHPDLDCQPIVEELLSVLEREPVITPDVVLQKVKENGQLPNFAAEGFQAGLDEVQAGGLNISGIALGKTKIEYRLPNGITIKGPRAAMESMVTVDILEDGSFEFRLQSPSYEKRYGS